MPRFPKDEANLIELAQKIASGIIKNPTTFPNSPVAGTVLQTDLNDYETKNFAHESARINANLI